MSEEVREHGESVQQDGDQTYGAESPQHVVADEVKVPAEPSDTPADERFRGDYSGADAVVTEAMSDHPVDEGTGFVTVRNEVYGLPNPEGGLLAGPEEARSVAVPEGDVFGGPEPRRSSSSTGDAFGGGTPGPKGKLGDAL